MNTRNLYPKAYYNLLRYQQEHDNSVPVEPWQIEDDREIPTPELFNRLKILGISLTEEQFLAAAENQTSPEELALAFKTSQKNEHPIYLLVFEIWRRLLPEKQSLSIFCDELDHLIYQYSQNPEEDENLRKALADLIEMLDETSEVEKNPKELFSSLIPHFAHNLDEFFFDYISDLLDKHAEQDAEEILDAFYAYLPDALWFDFLRARILILSNTHEGNIAFLKLLEKVQELDLLLEIAAFLIHHGDPSLFQKAACASLNLIKNEEDLQQLMAIVGDYYNSIGKEDAEERVQSRFVQRINIKQETPLKSDDPDVAFLKKLLEDPDWEKI